MSLLPVTIHAEEFTHGLFNQSDQNLNRPQLIKLNIDVMENVRIDFHEIFQSEHQRSLQKTNVIASSQGTQLTAVSSIDVPALKPSIEKRIPNLWRVVIPPDWPIIETPVKLYWEDQSIHKNITVTALIPWIQRKTKQKDGKTIIEGGITFKIKTSAIHSNTPISGKINIDLNYF